MYSRVLSVLSVLSTVLKAHKGIPVSTLRVLSGTLGYSLGYSQYSQCRDYPRYHCPLDRAYNIAKWIRMVNPPYDAIALQGLT